MRLPARLILALWSAIGLAGCGRDTTLLGDYKLYDFDGSNQTIIGNKGTVKVKNVTALASRNPLIFVEIGAEHPGNICSYKMIDTYRHLISDLPAGAGVERKAIAEIKAQEQKVVYRSCAVRNYVRS